MSRYDERGRRPGGSQDRGRRGGDYPGAQGNYRDDDDVYERDRGSRSPSQMQAFDDGSRSRGGSNHPYSGGYGGYGSGQRQGGFEQGGYGGWGDSGGFGGPRQMGGGGDFGHPYEDDRYSQQRLRQSGYGPYGQERYAQDRFADNDRFGGDRYSNDRYRSDRYSSERWQDRTSDDRRPQDPGMRQRLDEGYEASDWRHSNDQNQFDPDYWQWRQEQVRSLDNDYRSWRQDRYKKFSDEFSEWRSQRPSQDAQDKGRGLLSGSDPERSTQQSAASSTASSSKANR